MSTVLVTGGSRGIGRAICLAFVRAGYDVAFTYEKSDAAAEETARLIRAEGREPLVFRCDSRDEHAVEETVRSVFGLEVLVNNAGIALYKQIQDTSLQEWEDVFSVNAAGAFLFTKAALPKFFARGGGCVVNISSVWGETGASCEAAYSASKAALIGFTKAAAKELAPAGIRVNCLSVGLADTDMNARLSQQEKRDFLSEVPLGRACTPDEAAQAVLFLAKSKYITGEILRLNGGLFV